MKGKACGGKMSKGYAAGGKTNLQMRDLGRNRAKIVNQGNQKKTGSRRGG
jgi:hypothetical protein